MHTTEEIIREVRALFKQGATLARLVHHVLGCVPGEPSSRAVARILQEAFHLEMVRWIEPGVDYSGEHPVFKALNRHLIPEMIQRRPEWDDSPDSCWLDGLPHASSEAAWAIAEQEKHPYLSDDSWAKLSSQEQDSLRRVLVGARVNRELVAILNALSESLQQQVESLERQASVVAELSPLVKG